MKSINMKISGKELLLNSANKINKSMEQVRTGTGVHKSPKDYRRKPKHFKGWD